MSFNKNEFEVKLAGGFFIVAMAFVSLLHFVTPYVVSLEGMTNVVSGEEPYTPEAHPSAEDKIFTDVSSSHKNFQAILYLKKKGIFSGYEDGSFRPGNFLKRGELMKMIVLALKAEPHILSHSMCFRDVKTEWFAPFACYAKDQGWVQGFKDGRFYPEKEVSNAETVAMVVKAFKGKGKTVSLDGFDQIPSVFSDVTKDSWFASFVWTAYKKGYIENGSGKFFPNKSTTRAEVAEILYRAMTL